MPSHLTGWNIIYGLRLSSCMKTNPEHIDRYLTHILFFIVHRVYSTFSHLARRSAYCNNIPSSASSGFCSLAWFGRIIAIASQDMPRSNPYIAAFWTPDFLKQLTHCYFLLISLTLIRPTQPFIRDSCRVPLVRLSTYTYTCT